MRNSTSGFRSYASFLASLAIHAAVALCLFFVGTLIQPHTPPKPQHILVDYNKSDGEDKAGQLKVPSEDKQTDPSAVERERQQARNSHPKKERRPKVKAGSGAEARTGSNSKLGSRLGNGLDSALDSNASSNSDLDSNSKLKSASPHLIIKDLGLTPIPSSEAPQRTAEGSSTSLDSGSSDGPMGPPRAGSDPMASIGPRGHGWSEGTQYANAMDMVFVNESLNFFEALHRKVDGTLVFPEDFVRQRLKGKVRIDAEIGRDGRLIRFLSVGPYGSASLAADTNILAAYTVTLMTLVLDQPLRQQQWLKTEKAIVTFDFDYRIRLEGTPSTTLHSGIEKNRLAFAREGIVEPWINEKIREIFTHYVPPIIPLPGGFYVDFVMAYQYVDNLIKGAPVESDARKSRIDLLHEDLRRTIRRREQTASQ